MYYPKNADVNPDCPHQFVCQNFSGQVVICEQSMYELVFSVFFVPFWNVQHFKITFRHSALWRF